MRDEGAAVADEGAHVAASGVEASAVAASAVVASRAPSALIPSLTFRSFLFIPHPSSLIPHPFYLSVERAILFAEFGDFGHDEFGDLFVGADAVAP